MEIVNLVPVLRFTAFGFLLSRDFKCVGGTFGILIKKAKFCYLCVAFGFSAGGGLLNCLQEFNCHIPNLISALYPSPGVIRLHNVDYNNVGSIEDCALGLP